MDYQTIDELTNNKLVKCYQMQINENLECMPVYLGEYPDVPLPVNKSIKINNHVAYIVTYVLTEQEILDKLYKLVGVNIFTEDNKNSLCSVDLIYNFDIQKYQTIFNDHKLNTTTVIDTLSERLNKSQVLELVIKKTFESSLVENVLLIQ